MSHFWSMTSLVRSFCSISLILPLRRFFEQLDLIFTKCLWSKIVQHDQRKILVIYFFDSVSIWSMTSLETSFCSITLILPLHRLFEQLDLIFTKLLWGVKFFNMSRGRFWQYAFWYHVWFLIYVVISDVILLCFWQYIFMIPWLTKIC